MLSLGEQQRIQFCRLGSDPLNPKPTLDCHYIVRFEAQGSAFRVQGLLAAAASQLLVVGGGDLGFDGEGTDDDVYAAFLTCPDAR